VYPYCFNSDPSVLLSAEIQFNGGAPRDARITEVSSFKRFLQAVWIIKTFLYTARSCREPFRLARCKIFREAARIKATASPRDRGMPYRRKAISSFFSFLSFFFLKRPFSRRHGRASRGLEFGRGSRDLFYDFQIAFLGKITGTEIRQGTGPLLGRRCHRASLIPILQRASEQERERERELVTFIFPFLLLKFI